MGLARLLMRSMPTQPPLSLKFDTDGGGGLGPSRTRMLRAPTEQTALSIPAFWRGHAYVCGGIGMLPVTAWRGKDQLDPQPGVLRQPDPDMTPMAFWAGVTSALTLYGNALCVITSEDRLGYPATLHLIHPLRAAVHFSGNPASPGIDGWFLAGDFYDISQVWHIRSFLGRPGWPLGIGLLDGVADGVAAAQAVMDYAASYFAGGGVPPGVLKIHRPEITQKQADDAKSLWIQKYAGRQEPAVLNELTDFTPLAFRPVDSQMIEARQLTFIDVALMWGLPPTKLGATVGGGTYRNAEMEEVQARNDAITPWTRVLEQAISISLLPRGQSAQWDLKAFLQTDTLSDYQADQLALGGPGPQSAWQTLDEIRARHNLDSMAKALADQAAEDAEYIAQPEIPVIDPSFGGPPLPNLAGASNGNGRGGNH